MIAAEEPSPFATLLGRVAFLITLGVLVARMTMLETIRDAFVVNFGGVNVPRGAGAASAMLLDLLTCTPLLLVLLRRVVDSTYRVRVGWSHAVALVLAGLAMASTGWAADRFLSMTGAFHLAASLALLFSTVQLVRDWARLRMVAAICFGLLAVLVANGAYYRLVDLPELQRTFGEHREEMLRDRGMEPGSYAGRQFARKIEAGEMMGFYVSPNTFAAVLSVTSLVTVGILLQRLTDRDGAGFVGLFGAMVVGAGTCVYFTHSRAGAATMGLGIVILLALYGMPRLRGWVQDKAKMAYWAVVGVLVLGGAALVGHGIYHGRLPGDSLNFRWRYWVATGRLIRDHLAVGVGWNNFSEYFLEYRLQSTAEEIKDPHNFVLKFFAELGIVGGVVAVAWLMRLWWEMTRPVLSAGEPSEVDADAVPHMRPIWNLAAVAGLGTVLNILASVDFDQGWSYATVEVFKRGLFACVLVLAAAFVAIKHFDQPDPDRRPAMWMVYGMLVGIGLFLLHSLNDVAMFEMGPLLLFCVVAGSVLGMRGGESTEPRQSTATAVAGLSIATAGWLAAMVGIVVPVVKAEALAVEGDAEMRAKHADRAAQRYAAAAEALPGNSEYAYRAARAALAVGDLGYGSHYLDEAIAKDPMDVEYYLTRAGVALAGRPVDVRAVRRDYERALALNPADVRVRVSYADVLVGLGLREEARKQYQTALERNEGYDVTEPKRLTDQEIEKIRAALAGL